MFEFPFISEDVVDCGPSARLDRLKVVADKLLQAEWSIGWTITGLAFEPPWNLHKPADVRQSLSEIGISEEFRRRSSRSLLDILTAKVEYTDRAYYATSDNELIDTLNRDHMDWEDKEYIIEILRKRFELEEQYTKKELLVETDYQRGQVLGRLQALEWLFGKEWPVLASQEDEWDAELAKDERDEVNAEVALEGMHALLFEKEAEQENQVHQARVEPQSPDVQPTAISAYAFEIARLAKARNAPRDEKTPSPVSG